LDEQGGERLAKTDRHLSVFGGVVARLMVARGILRWSELAQRVSEASGTKEYKAQRVRSWVRGDVAVDRDFPAALAVALDLSDDEKYAVAMAYTFGQRVSMKDERAREMLGDGLTCATL
jgi:hypothetical protein